MDDVERMMSLQEIQWFALKIDVKLNVKVWVSYHESDGKKNVTDSDHCTSLSSSKKGFILSSPLSASDWL